MIRLKTAVFLACAAKMGALIAGADAADCEALYAFAERIGLAFQIQDDYLDVYGDQKVFGKKIGGDILCGKRHSCSSTRSTRPTMPRANACKRFSTTTRCLPKRRFRP